MFEDGGDSRRENSENTEGDGEGVAHEEDDEYRQRHKRVPVLVLLHRSVLRRRRVHLPRRPTNRRHNIDIQNHKEQRRQHVGHQSVRDPFLD